jgi:SAM-dependent methyltransferase
MIRVVDAEPPRGGQARSSPEEFDAIYAAGAPPWDIGRPQPAFLELADAGVLTGRVLDVGCGTGEHALMAAARGLDATGIDSARDRGLAAPFLVWDALDLGSLEQRFDTVLDCGLFHVFDDHARVRFVESLAAATVPGARYHMLCFSDRQPGDWGPRRVSRREIRSSFARGWRVASIEPATLHTTLDVGGVQAWRSAVTRR